MIKIDGAEGSAGGQILRTAIGLSALTGKPFQMINVRKGRCNPGLQEQHLQAVRAVEKLCNAEVKGAQLYSTEIEFNPGKIISGKIPIQIETAGSVGLVLQALLIPGVKTDVTFDIRGGGTYGKWASPVDFLDYILKFYLKIMGYDFMVDVKREGFFPKGGAHVIVRSKKGELKPLDVVDHGKLIDVSGISKASDSLKSRNVAERQANAAKKILRDYFDKDVNMDVSYSNSICPGTGIQLWVKSENSIVGGNSFGDKGKPAEVVGQEAAKKLIEEYEGGVVDKNAADQLIPYMGIAQGSKIKTSQITNHIKTNIHTVEKFLDVKFEVEGNIIRTI